MVYGKPATEFISSLGGLLADTINRERTKNYIDSRADQD
jgi:ribosome biogenesis SPOUT family RNA methylase Rps3